MRKILTIGVALSILALGGCSKSKNSTNPNSDDTTNPVVVFVSPLNGGTLGLGQDTLRVIATDNVGVSGVQFYDGSTLLGTGAAGSNNTYSFVWTPATAGSHTVKAIATDAAGNTGQATVSISVTGGPTLHSGNITESETWYPTGNPHRITSDVQVEDAVNSPILTIMPGCIVELGAGTELYCGYNNAGAIHAVGKPDSLITFTTTSIPKTAGSYKSVSAYEHSTATTIFSYCVFEYGGYNAGQGNLYISDVAVSVTNCTVRNSGTSGIKFVGELGRPNQFTNNAVVNCDGHAVEIAADYVRYLGAGNTISGNTNNDIFVYTGPVKNTGTWRNHGAPYLLSGDINVGDNANSPVLTIAPGCTLKLGSDIEFYCGYDSPGTIVAEGKADSIITFTTVSNPPSPGSWRAIEVYEKTSNAVSFNYCRFEYGGSTEGYGELYIENKAVKVTNCVITQSQFSGIKLAGTGTFSQFTGNTVSNCGAHAIVLLPDYVKSIGTGNTFTANTNNDIYVLGGRVSATCTWSNQGVPYLIAGDINIEDATNSPVLTIAPGTTLKMQSGVELYTGYNNPGGLIADGTSAQITFTSAIASPSPGDWQTISFYSKAMDAASKLKNCVIEYAGGLNANVYVSDANPEITGCNIRHSSKWGIYLGGATHPDAATLEATNTFSDNADGNVGP